MDEEANQYKLNISRAVNTALAHDGMIPQNGQKFYTIDRDSDKLCSDKYGQGLDSVSNPLGLVSSCNGRFAEDGGSALATKLT